MTIKHIIKCDICGRIFNALKECYRIRDEEDICGKCFDEENAQE